MKKFIIQDGKNQPKNFPVDLKKITDMVEKCGIGVNIVEEFSELNLSEQKEFGKKISSFVTCTPGPNALAFLFQGGVDSTEIFSCVIKELEDYRKTHPELSYQESPKHWLAVLLENYLFIPSNQKMKFQRQILILLLEYFERNVSLYGQFIISIKVIRQAMEFGSDDAALYLLDCHGNFLKNNGLCQGLLNIVCKSIFIKPRCVMELVALDAKLPSNYDKSLLSGQFDESPSKVDMPEFVKLLNDSGIKIPVISKYFMNDGGIKQKGLFIKSAFKECDDSVWEALEKAIVQSAKAFRDNNDGSHLPHDRALNRLHQIVLDHIKMVFDINPVRTLSSPNEFEYIAFISIYKQHPLIHTLLDRGLKLNQALSADSWPNVHDYAFHCTEVNSLADMVAFYSHDFELLKKLDTVNLKNKFGRTPAHYAILAALALEDARIDRWFSIIENKSFPSYEHRKEAYLEGDENLTEEKMILLNKNHPTYLYYYNLFNINNIITCFMPKYSGLASKNSNLASDMHVPDRIGLTPLDYAAMLTDKAKKDEIFGTFRQFLFKNIASTLFFPSVLIQLINDYLVDAPSKEETDSLIIMGAENLVAQADQFTPEFQNFLIKPLKPYLDNHNEFKLSSRNFQGTVGLARTVLQLFNYVTFAGTISQFEPIGSEPTDSKEHLTEQHFTYNFSFASNQVSIFSSSSSSVSTSAFDSEGRKRKFERISRESNDTTKKPNGQF